MKRVIMAAVILAVLTTTAAVGLAKPLAGIGSKFGTLGGDFTLTGVDTKPVGLKDFRGKTVLMMFGFTNCPSACPTTLLTLKRVLARLGARGRQVKIIFVSVDPDRDSPGELKTFLEFFDPAIVGMTGTRDQISDVAVLYKTFFKKMDKGSAAGYLVAHTDYIYLIDGLGRTRSIYNSKTKVSKMVEGIRELWASG